MRDKVINPAEEDIKIVHNGHGECRKNDNFEYNSKSC